MDKNKIVVIVPSLEPDDRIVTLVENCVRNGFLI